MSYNILTIIILTDRSYIFTVDSLEYTALYNQTVNSKSRTNYYDYQLNYHRWKDAIETDTSASDIY